ncbi:hypothetical protein B0H14DRAFT_2591851 [Mycena olivaceomarginata]|nr:hypothetical protein B0H14DRAFT_2591851 [Mycena olivaceomarginata]
MTSFFAVLPWMTMVTTFYDRYTDAFKDMDNNLAVHEFGKTFDRTADEKGRLSLRDQASLHRMVIGARCPTSATREMRELWGASRHVWTKPATMSEILEWTSRDEDDKDKPADILFQMEPTYEKPLVTAQSSTSRCVSETQERGHTTSTTRKIWKCRVRIGAASAVSGREVGDTYSTDILPDHQHLLCPREVSLSTYINEAQEPAALGFQVYHVNVEKLTILDKEDGAPGTLLF